MKLTRRSLASSAVVVALFAAVGVATWLGVSESPNLGGGLTRFIADSKADGTVDFVLTLRTAGFGGSLERVHGEIDFADGDGREVSETTTAQARPQYIETVVVDGAAFARPAVDRSSGPHFKEVWQRLSAGISVPPFAPLAGAATPMAVPPHLVRLSDSTIGGVPVTEYQVASFSVSCPSGTGPGTSLHETTWLWVDGQGRIRRFEERVEAHIGDVAKGLSATTVVSFGHFGAPVSVSAPTTVLGVTPHPTKPVDPYAGCLVTPG